MSGTSDFYSDNDRLIKRLSINLQKKDFEKAFYVVKNYSESDSKEIERKIQNATDIDPEIYILPSGSLIIGKGDSGRMIQNPVSSPIVSNREKSGAGMESSYQLKRDKLFGGIPKYNKQDNNFFLSRDYKWILYRKTEKDYKLLYNPLHFKNFASMVSPYSLGDDNKPNPLFKLSSGELDRDKYKAQLTDIQSNIINPYCVLVKNSDPLCICSPNDEYKACIEEMFSGDISTFNKIPSVDVKNEVKKNCRCVNLKCKLNQDISVGAYNKAIDFTSGVCSTTIQMVNCFIDIQSDGQTVNSGTIQQKCDASMSSGTNTQGGGETSEGGSTTTTTSANRGSSTTSTTSASASDEKDEGKDEEKEDKTSEKSLIQKFKDLKTEVKAAIIIGIIVIVIIIMFLIFSGSDDPPMMSPPMMSPPMMSPPMMSPPMMYM